MLIQTLKRRFEVLQVLDATRDTEVLICRDLWEEGERKYLLVVMKNPDLIYRSAPFFVEQSGNDSFKDLIECFSRESQFYVVFAYYEKPLLGERYGEERYTLSERLEIGKSLLSRMVLQNMPPSIQCEALQERNLRLDSSLQVYFNYILEEVPAYGTLNLGRVQMELARIFRLLLRQEIATQVVEEVQIFVDNLEQGEFRNYLEIYEAYDRLYVLLRGLQEVGEIHPKSFLFRLWERIKGLLRYAKPILAGLILATALGFLIYTIVYPSQTPGSPPVVIEAIGTVRAE